VNQKVKTLPALLQIVRRLKKQGKRIVFTNGCFDLLHLGHVTYLDRARSKGDRLVVAINSDRSVRKLKGKERPLVPQSDRAGVLAGLASVDYVAIFDEPTPLSLIQAIRPDILVKGADWAKGNIVGGDFVERRGGRVVTIALVKGVSTTEIIKRIVERYAKKKK
jgi:D-beta-D-heptose 7-phosphate kinase/D-beta-D-heptose 1-phosphate adenosyltransferase